MESNLLICKKCGKKFVDSSTYNQHILTHEEIINTA